MALPEMARAISSPRSPSNPQARQLRDRGFEIRYESWRSIAREFRDPAQRVRGAPAPPRRGREALEDAGLRTSL